MERLACESPCNQGTTQTEPWTSPASQQPGPSSCTHLTAHAHQAHWDHGCADAALEPVCPFCLRPHKRLLGRSARLALGTLERQGAPCRPRCTDNLHFVPPPAANSRSSMGHKMISHYTARILESEADYCSSRGTKLADTCFVSPHVLPGGLEKNMHTFSSMSKNHLGENTRVPSS